MENKEQNNNMLGRKVQFNLPKSTQMIEENFSTLYSENQSKLSVNDNNFIPHEN
jgi:hypothetical protein